ncbi:hypothetical protein AC781_08515 [Akkermansia glycaniphila]|nr:hypothetical protein AC781_08515 [Akkermansia glycaniphila]
MALWARRSLKSARKRSSKFASLVGSRLREARRAESSCSLTVQARGSSSFVDSVSMMYRMV